MRARAQTSSATRSSPTSSSPTSWPRFELAFKYRSARYDITVENPQRVSRGVSSATLDGNALPSGAARIPLVDDGATHSVRVILG